MAEQGREPERQTTRVLKSMSFGGRPVTAVVPRVDQLHLRQDEMAAVVQRIRECERVDAA